MIKKETVLINVSYLLDLTKEELADEEDILDKITLGMGKDEQVLINGKKIDLKWEGTTSFVLNPDEINCGKCTNCGSWVTDMEKPNPIHELCNGATVDGNLLCDECLPPKHRWAF